MSNSNKQFTKGPWILNVEDGHVYISAPHPEDKGSLVDVASVFGFTLEKNQNENARLIVAAPEMLEALELILSDDRLMNAMNKQRARAILDSVSRARGKV